ncbi:hypothetical protein ANO14919_140160 [Xylariales sp. No.14919]|nr:hypothetical protein ANO14919_140160 [Xylariales sp. No.14919]
MLAYIRYIGEDSDYLGGPGYHSVDGMAEANGESPELRDTQDIGGSGLLYPRFPGVLARLTVPLSAKTDDLV